MAGRHNQYEHGHHRRTTSYTSPHDGQIYPAVHDPTTEVTLPPNRGRRRGRGEGVANGGDTISDAAVMRSHADDRPRDVDSDVSDPSNTSNAPSDGDGSLRLPPFGNGAAPSDEDEDDDDEDDVSLAPEDDPSEEPPLSPSQSSPHSPSAPSATVARPNLPSVLLTHRREIGSLATWSLSSAKPGNGVLAMRDGSPDTYWQSDGAQPHLINIQWGRRTAVSELAFYLDYGLDESYTPKRLTVRVGMTFHDLVEIQSTDLHEPVGWIVIPLRMPSSHLHAPRSGNDDEEASDGVLGIRAHFVQICVPSMHQNGRDTHIRQARVFGPRTDQAVGAGRSALGAAGKLQAMTPVNSGGDGRGANVARDLAPIDPFVIPFQTVEFLQYATIR